LPRATGASCSRVARPRSGREPERPIKEEAEDGPNHQ
jgi:hypothetical protein